MLHKGDKYLIVFRTQELTERILENGGAVQDAIQAANESVRLHIQKLHSSKAKEHTFVNFELKTD